MKPWLLIMLAYFLLVACTKHGAPPPPEEDMLYRVECFFQSKPDSAMQILDTLNLSVLSEKERAHYCPLRLDILHNEVYWNIEIDSLLQVAEDQFIGGDDKYFEARTYNARAYACQSLPQKHQLFIDNQLKAKQSIDQCRHVDERFVLFSPAPTTEQDEIDRVKSEIYRRLGKIYCDFGYPREGIGILKEVEGFLYEKQWHDKHWMAALLLGDSYLYVKEYDSSMMYLERSFHSAKMTGVASHQAVCHIAVALHLLYRYEKQKDIADDEKSRLLQQAILEEKEALKVGDLMDRFKSTANDGLAHAYYELRQYDSCIHYAKQILELDGLEVWKMNANMYLYKSYKALGDLENALSYAEKYMDDRRKFDNGGKAVSEVKEEYDRQLELQRVDSEQKLKRMWLYLLIAMLVIALLLLWLFVLRYRKNKELETLQLHEAQRQLQADLEQLTVQQKEMLQQQVVAIYQTGQKDRLQRIMEAFETVYPNALEKLKSAYPDLNKTELNLVFLSFFQFRIKEEADLLGISENTVMKYRSKLNKKVDFASISTLTD